MLTLFAKILRHGNIEIVNLREFELHVLDTNWKILETFFE